MNPDRQPLFIALALAALALAAFGGVLTCDFVSLDDPTHVYQNRVVLTCDIAGAFTTTPAALWIPVTWLSYMLDYSLAGLHPAMFHLTNLLLHALNAVLVWRWLEGATGRRWLSVAVAAAFAAHPLNVESVAWITERKNVLSTSFWLLALMAWTRFARTDKWRDYALALLAGSLALMSKPMAVTIAGTLFLLDLWPLDRRARHGWVRLIVDKIPFVLLAAFVSYMTVRGHAEHSGLMPASALAPHERLLNAAAAYGLYLRQLVWPSDLALLVRHPQLIPLGASIGGIVAVVVLSALAWRLRKREPAVLWGWAWYLGTLLPVSGIMQAGSEASADRFTYVPMLGIFVAIVWLAAPLAEVRPRLVRGVGAAVLACWFALTVRQVAFWESSLTLFDRTLAINPQSHRGLIEAGSAHAEHGDFNGAVRHFHAALKIIPVHVRTWTLLGQTFAKMGDKPRAEFALRQALKHKPGDERAQRSLEALDKLPATPPQRR